VLKARGTLPFCRTEPGLEVREVELGTGGLARAARRMLWETIVIPGLVRSIAGTVYLTFSHFLPLNFPRDVVSVVGVSNLAPFSAAAIRIEGSLMGRLRLRTLQFSILSSVRRASSVIALSGACRDVLVARGLNPEKIRVISNGVELVPAKCGDRSVLRTLGLTPGYLLSVSHFYWYKNFERLVHAYGLLSADLRNRFPLVIVGKPIDADCYRHIERCIRDAGLANQVTLVPGLESEALAQLYANAALFVFPSLVENSPNIMLEAMASGLPVLAGKVAPMPEFGGKAAVYFDPFSAGDIARVITEVTADEHLRHRMRADSLSQAARFTWDNFTAQVVAVYRNAAALASRGSADYEAPLG
jgi:glycosyltransferase involved in cell wall biosynthesis